MEQQLNNAVTHYRYLREQGKTPSDALAHAVQRFGVSSRDLRHRINGFVADSDATQAALAEARDYLAKGHMIWTETDDLLQSLYNAITGEGI